MTEETFAFLFSEALTYSDGADSSFLADWVLAPHTWHGEDPKRLVGEMARDLLRVWDLAHLSVADIRHATGLTQEAFCERFCIPRSTLQGWERRGREPVYLRLMLVRLCGLADGIVQTCSAPDSPPPSE